jgi:hypothetical protein
VTRLDATGERLERLARILSDKNFLTGRGIGNEISFHIFAYDPAFEPVVTAYLPKLKEQLAAAGVKVLEFDLYRLILELLEERDLLEKSFMLEAQKGVKGLEKALRKVIRPETLITAMQERLLEPHDLVLISGVGAAYPLVRSHTVLNNLHHVIDTCPLVMFFPGAYDGEQLRLFNVLKDDNYYRAFPLLPEVLR